MNDVQLQSFLSTARTGSFTRAAKELYVSTPSLMQRINALETELGCTLFTRNSKGAQLTDAGVAFVDTATVILSTFEAGKERIARTSQAAKKIVLGVYLRLPAFLVETIAHYKALHEDTAIELKPLQPASLDESLLKGEFDVCLFQPLAAMRERGICYTELIREESMCLFRPGHPFESHEHIPAELLKGQRVVVEKTIYRLDACGQLRPFLENVIECDNEFDDSIMIRCMDESTVTVCTSEYGAAHCPPLAIRPFEEKLDISTGLLYKASDSDRLDEFVRFCVRAASNSQRAS